MLHERSRVAASPSSQATFFRFRSPVRLPAALPSRGGSVNLMHGPDGAAHDESMRNDSIRGKRRSA